MEKTNLIYHICVVLISIIVFFMRITSNNEHAQLLYRTIGKVVPIFCIMYAVVQIFKFIGII
jgi:hypothetical protein